MTTSRLGSGLDLYDIENPVIELRMSTATAERLRDFLQQHNVGTDDVLGVEVYQPIRDAQKRVSHHFVRLARNAEREATALYGRAAYLAERAANAR